MKAKEKKKKEKKESRLFLTFLLCMGLQKTVDKKVHHADGVISPLSQTSDEMLQIFFQVGTQKHTWVRDLWLDDGRHRLRKKQD